MNTGKDWGVRGEAIVKSLEGSTSRLILADSAGKLTALANGSNGHRLALVAGVPTWAATAVSDVTGLQTALDGKANLGHGHSISEIANLQTTLDGKAPTSHSHSIANVTGLQTALDSKANTSHGHTISEIANLQTALDAKANTSHTHTKSQITDWAHSHAISDVTGLQTALDGKAAVSHTQAISTITGLQTALDGKSNTGHGHQMSEIANLQDELGDIWDAILALQGGGGGGLTSIVMPDEFYVSIVGGVATVTWVAQGATGQPWFLASQSAGGVSEPRFRPIDENDF